MLHPRPCWLRHERRPDMPHGLLLIASVCLSAASVSPAPQPPQSVGQVFIAGNEAVPQDIILDWLPLYPGQVLSPTDIAEASRTLSWLRPLGIRSSVSIVDEGQGGEFKDILVEV